MKYSTILTRVDGSEYTKEQEGTCFTVNIEDVEYLVTATHLVENFNKRSYIEILSEEGWQKIDVDYIGHGVPRDRNMDPPDISVFKGDLYFSPGTSHKISIDAAGLVYSQEVRFLGFPGAVDVTESYNKMWDKNRGFPLPVCKSAIVSWMNGYILIDTVGGGGFSGSPVLANINGKIKVIAVISGYAPDILPVYATRDGARTKDDNCKKTGWFRENNGLIKAYYTHEITRIIEANT